MSKFINSDMPRVEAYKNMLHLLQLVLLSRATSMMKPHGDFIICLKDNDGNDCVLEMGEGYMQKDGYCIIVDGLKLYIDSPVYRWEDILKLMQIQRQSIADSLS